MTDLNIEALSANATTNAQGNHKMIAVPRDLIGAVLGMARHHGLYELKTIQWLREYSMVQALPNDGDLIPRAELDAAVERARVENERPTAKQRRNIAVVFGQERCEGMITDDAEPDDYDYQMADRIIRILTASSEEPNVAGLIARARLEERERCKRAVARVFNEVGVPRKWSHGIVREYGRDAISAICALKDTTHD
jgi:hypothetical protein